MPLCWSHAEYLLLVRSRNDGVCFERVEPVFKRYVINKTISRHDIWSFSHRIKYLTTGKTLRIIVESDAVITWSADGWANLNKYDTKKDNILNLWYADLPTENLEENCEVLFTFVWKKETQWEEANFSVKICNPK